MKASLEEYLRHTKSHKLPALLIDIFVYLGAKKYVEHVIEPAPHKLFTQTMDSEVLSLQIKTSDYMKLRMIKSDNELIKWRVAMGDSKVEDYWKAFKKFSDFKMKPDNEVFVTLSSIMNNFQSVFGVKNDFMAR